MYKIIFRLITVLLLCSAGLVTANEPATSAAATGVEGFTALERGLIKRYFDGETEPLGRSGIVFNKATLEKKKEQAFPGGMPKKELPPDLAAQLKRNNTFPPGLAKRALPTMLEKQLPPVPAGYERSQLDDLTIVLIETESQRIVDMITGIVVKAKP
jgi:hypothetical protein